MIDLLINRKTRLPIVAKPAGSKWGYREIDGPNLCVVQIDDPPAELAARVAKHGVVANPFAEYEQRELTPGGATRSVMVRQSTVKLKSADVRAGARVAMDSMEATTVERP